MRLRTYIERNRHAFNRRPGVKKERFVYEMARKSRAIKWSECRQSTGINTWCVLVIKPTMGHRIPCVDDNYHSHHRQRIICNTHLGVTDLTASLQTLLVPPTPDNLLSLPNSYEGLNTTQSIFHSSPTQERKRREKGRTRIETTLRHLILL